MTRTPDRRSFLLAAAMALAGCAPGRQGPGPAAHPLAAGARDPARRPSAGLTAHTGAAPGPVPTRNQVTAMYAGRTTKYWGLEAPGVLTRLPPGTTGVALTFDFCGGVNGNGADLALLSVLRQQHVPATLFLSSRWITANPALAMNLAGDPLFELANHGTSHRPLSVTGRSAYGIRGTRNPAEVYDEIMTNDACLTQLTGRRSRYFRPGTAYLDDVSAAIVRSLGLIPVGFSINGDAGATFPAATVTREISLARAGDIVIAHGNHPGGGTAPGVEHALKVMKARGDTFLPLPRTTNA
ncbi:polysaccharide deacetylase family protein [Arthrobacter oryzae]|uniref:Peptidoglycan/xylan/chitin deacetylase (PgdA/CDA1 family) n=1 Tax=Arthrobacter oryzae TaxID=409290 RepID=A0A495FPY6_9MICC|nr:polysaccharide deacetylase family protein [Arthrobacter oryzae]RKR30516.1 peptidoglycan/xylan/chitin deacetylase (PgdA/CDA1 family) [Arthrobacter oryzae]